MLLAVAGVQWHMGWWSVTVAAVSAVCVIHRALALFSGMSIGRIITGCQGSCPGPLIGALCPICEGFWVALLPVGIGICGPVGTCACTTYTGVPTCCAGVRLTFCSHIWVCCFPSGVCEGWTGALLLQ